MRLSFGVFIALLCHGVMYEVMTPARATPARVATDAVELDVFAARPDPTADAFATGQASSTKLALPVRRPRPARRTSRPPTSAVADAATSAVVAEAAVVVTTSPPSTGAQVPTIPATRLADHPVVSSGTVLMAKPRYRTNPPPEYPIASRRRGEEGVVLLSVAVDASGAPTTIALSRTSGYPLLDQAALDAVRRWSFEPARAAGVPMLSTVIVPVRFSLSDGP